MMTNTKRKSKKQKTTAASPDVSGGLSREGIIFELRLSPVEPTIMRYNPALACEVGLLDSLLLLQLEFLINLSRREKLGRLWTYQTLQDLKDNYFPSESASTISRAIRRLEEGEYIKVHKKLNKHKYDRTQWFSLNEVGLRNLKSVTLIQNEIPSSQNRKGSRAECEMQAGEMKNSTGRNDKTIPETTTENTTENTTERVRALSGVTTTRGLQPAKEINISEEHPAVSLYLELLQPISLTEEDKGLIRNEVKDMGDIPLWEKVLRQAKERGGEGEPVDYLITDFITEQIRQPLAGNEATADREMVPEPKTRPNDVSVNLPPAASSNEGLLTTVTEVI